MEVYRGMKPAPDSSEPRTGMNMTSLGVRVRDLHPRLDGIVDPELGGLSVYLSIERVPQSVKPEHLGGFARNSEVFVIETNDLPETLAYREDPEKLGEHGFIEPDRPMKFEEYQRTLWATSGLWRSV